jgi:hypothetical protein
MIVVVLLCLKADGAHTCALLAAACSTMRFMRFMPLQAAACLPLCRLLHALVLQA